MKGRTVHEEACRDAAALALTAAGARRRGRPDRASSDSGRDHDRLDPPADRRPGRRRALMDDGAKLAVDDINKAGGIEALDGAELKLASGDSKGKAEIGQSEAQRLIDDGAVALVGTYQSDVTQNVASVAERSRVPLVIDVAVDDKILDQGYQYTFRIQPNATSMGTAGADSPRRDRRAGWRPGHAGRLHPHRGRVRRQRLRGLQGQAGREPGHHRRQGDHLLADQLLRRHHAGPRGRGGRPRRHRRPPATTPTASSSPRPCRRSSPTSRRSTGSPTAPSTTDLPRRRRRRRRGRASARTTTTTRQRAQVQDIRTRFEKEYGKPMETAAVLSYQAVEVIAPALEEAVARPTRASCGRPSRGSARRPAARLRRPDHSTRPARTRTPP